MVLFIEHILFYSTHVVKVWIRWVDMTTFLHVVPSTRPAGCKEGFTWGIYLWKANFLCRSEP